VSTFAFRDYRCVIRLRNNESVTGYDLSFDPQGGLRFGVTKGAATSVAVPLDAVQLVLFTPVGQNTPRVRFGNKVVTVHLACGEVLTGRTVVVPFGDGVWIAPDGVELGQMLAFVPTGAATGMDTVTDAPGGDGGFGAEPTGHGLESWLAYTGSHAIEDIWQGAARGAAAAPEVQVETVPQPESPRPLMVPDEIPQELDVAATTPGFVPPPRFPPGYRPSSAPPLLDAEPTAPLGSAAPAITGDLDRYPEMVLKPQAGAPPPPPPPVKTSSGFTDRHEMAVDPYEEDTELGFGDDSDLDVSVDDL